MPIICYWSLEHYVGKRYTEPIVVPYVAVWLLGVHRLGHHIITPPANTTPDLNSREIRIRILN